MENTAMEVMDLQRTVDNFVDAFNRNDLDRVMQHFAADARYLPGNGREFRGLAAIRRAFEPQFSFVYGVMRFDEHDRIIDTGSRKGVIRWICRMDYTGSKYYSFPFWIQRLAAILVYGKRVGYEGLDVFHFNAEGKIAGKFTYANYPWPLLRKDLGVALTNAR